jgi:cyclic beta-1,2-glucan synthetase
VTSSAKLIGYLLQKRSQLPGSDWSRVSGEEEAPLRSDLFSAEQMAQHAKALAGAHQLAAGRAPDQLLGRLAANQSALVGACSALSLLDKEKRRITPAAEWLLDNFYLIEEQISTARRHLPKGYSRELPRLANGPSAGRPRVYDIALEIISHGDGRVDGEGLRHFIAAYQSVTPLRLGELWATPIMLRLAVIENLRRVATRVAGGWADRSLADTWADQMTQTAEKDPKSLILVIADMARSNPPMASAFVAELARRLQGRGPALSLPLTWIEQRLSESGLTIEQLVQSEIQRQAADQVSISNSIGSLRILGTIDWCEFVESMSVVEQMLLADPAGVYGRMDFASRDHYRHAAETIARKGRLTELAVARAAVELALAARARDSDGRVTHVGYYLIGRGRPQLERVSAVRSSAGVLRRTAARQPLLLYLGAIGVLTAVFTWSLLPAVSAWALAPLLLLLLLATSQPAVQLVNWLGTLLVTPRPLPRMDFSEGIPLTERTLVVVPTLLSNARNIEDLVEALEVRFLANRDQHLHFGLLTDFRDARQESLPGDGPLLHLAQTRIEALNEKYGSGESWSRSNIFFLFHRPRIWNPQEQLWMGYERKRGKLADLNALLRGSERGVFGPRFSLIVGDTAVLSDVRFVITLDSDTQLPRDAARQFIGTMAHPLNRPRYDPAKGRVVEGYGILQPRLAVSLPGSNRSLYARLYSGEAGIDPYTRAVSDVYQDLFAEGSFIGKGIYDIDAFEQALGGRFPENRILSHDLLEGCYARSGLLSDVHLYEDYPAHYSADVSRRQRWIRGDWQLAGWLLRRVPCPAVRQRSDDRNGRRGPRQDNPLSFLAQWKLIDNLRRSLVPTALVSLLLLGWTVLSPAWFWTLSVIAVMLVPALCSVLIELVRKPPEVLLRQHLTAVAHALGRHLAQFAFELACLPYEACFSLDAILRTAWRMLISHRRLLEWVPSEAANGDSVTPRAMWIAPALAVLIAIYLGMAHPAALLAAAPLLALWFVSPLLVFWVSRPRRRREAALSTDQMRFLRLLARRTWAFFDRFVGPEDHWLPPDNYQEYRVGVVAHRTSPTNIGLALLANLAAHDFGYIPSGQLVERTAHTLLTMEGLARYRGHFYNWYDTQTLRPLLPLYVSSVDSGNLAGHLLTLRAGLLALVDEPVFAARLFDGLRDTLDILLLTANRALTGKARAFRELLAAASAAPAASLAVAYRDLQRLADSAGELLVEIPASLDLSEDPQPASEADEWAQALARQCHEALDELTFLAPWLLLPSPPAGVPDDLARLVGLAPIPTLRGLARLDGAPALTLAAGHTSATASVQRDWLAALQRELIAGSARARERIATIEGLARQANEFSRLEYGFLFDKTCQLLSIGYNVGERRLDAGYYDLLASEARLGCFVAIAQGQLPQASWFALGRLLTAAGGEPVLLSWSGSMFEYLMPLLVMPAYENSLLDQTCKAAVARQIEYGRQRGVAWGVSESGYNRVDANLIYQYQAFGVPGLGLKRGLAEDLVIAPYASVMALMVAPEEACRNLQRLASEGALGKFGFFEAIDHTPARQRRDQSCVAVRAFMAHHQGMSLLALAYLLLDRPMQRRFASNPLFQAVMLLLQERIPRATALHSGTTEIAQAGAAANVTQMPIRVFSTPDTRTPEVQLLSNGRYHVMVTNAGGGYSRWKDFAVSRWREDGTCDNWGIFCYLRDVASGTVWSTSHQPTLRRPTRYAAIFSEGRAEFRRQDALEGRDDIVETHTEIVVSPEDDIELRRIHITNRSRQRREIELTSYAEVVLAPPAADALHPAFSNLFVQTEILRERQAILCRRRPRAQGELTPWGLHLMAVHAQQRGDVSYETDRLRFIGRTRSTASPLAMEDPASLGDGEGSVLDPIVAIRCRIVLEAEASTIIDLVFGVAETRNLAEGLVDKYHDRNLADRVFELAHTHSQVVLQQLNASETDSLLYARLASSVIYANASLRADAALLVRNRRGQSGLWGYAISGDLPIVLLKIGDPANIELVRQLVQAHAYWRLKGLVVDLVIWNEDHGGYRQQLQEQIMGLVASSVEASLVDRPGGVFVRVAEQISNEDRILFQSVARAVIADQRGTLAEQLEHRRLAEPRPPRLKPRRTRVADSAEAIAAGPELILFNGLGGFTVNGREYVITLAPGRVTPAPWVNVLANPHFGTIVSESGLAYTWSQNAHEFRLTPWHNDPVSDASGEALYLRDDDTGHVWSPTPLPAPAAVSYRIRHGFGYSVFETRSGGIVSELWIYVAIDAAVKFSVLKVRNESGRPRRISATGYVEWVLGDLRARSAMHVSTEIAAQSGALYARNPYNSEFADCVAFFDVDDQMRTLSGDRSEFLGRNGSLRAPAALARWSLSGKVGPALDPCAAIQVSLNLGDGQERELVFRLGVGRNGDDAGHLVQRFRGALAARNALEAVQRHWQQTLGTLQVDTPEPSVNVLSNGWLVYQTLACRIWARSGYYQSGGAFGFRDQLQDVMALVHARPELVREHLLLCASRQFEEGDVQHWWHPPSGRGVRTHCSDDYLWLPLAVCRYVLASGDRSVLDEPVPFLEGRPVNPDDDSYYDLPGLSSRTASLYQHCVRAIQHGLRFGEHGLPLIGSGDWNDGMNLVGMHGKGESIWLGFFVCEVLRQFTELAQLRGDTPLVDFCRAERLRLRQNIEQHGWDGEWYRRAYFDDGTPLGSARNVECRIDSISQSWSVLCEAGDGAADRARSLRAMNAVYERLVRRDDALIQLLDPPFDQSSLDPGYIRGYVPGVRENGGQYTHGAVWAAMAFAALGEHERAWELLTLINPVNHALSPSAVATYKVEPYVVTADVYAVAPHTGRGGWSWYTGSAGWMYRLIIESLLGLRLAEDRLHINPCLPAAWPGYRIDYRYRETVYHIEVRQTDADDASTAAPMRVTVDGVTRTDGTIPLVDDHRQHRIEVHHKRTVRPAAAGCESSHDWQAT